MGSPENAKATNPTAKMSRRHFIKCTGTIVFALGPGCYMFACNHTALASNSDHSNSGIPPSHGYLLVDVKKCQGCMSCMLACTLVHEGVQNLSLARIQIIQNPFEAYPDDLTIAQCRQCVEPACVEACPQNAITAPVAFGHVRVIDKKNCIGCGECQAACPFTPGRLVLSPDEGHNGDIKAYKCDLCYQAPYHWDEAGGGPGGKQACVEVCPVGAIQFTEKIPVQEGDRGYYVDLRGRAWQRLGY